MSPAGTREHGCGASTKRSPIQRKTRLKDTPLRPSTKRLERGSELRRSSRLRAPGTPARTDRGWNSTLTPSATGLKVRRVSKRFAKRRDPAYKAWIVTLPCILTGRWPVDPAHVRGRNAGGWDYANIVPLVHELHRELHDHGPKTFAAKYRVDLAREAALLAVRYDDEMGRAA